MTADRTRATGLLGAPSIRCARERGLGAALTRPTLAEIARAFILVGTQSIGGGSSTLYLIRLVIVERRAWMGRREFAELVAFSQLSPGVHLVALAALIGHRLAGPWGIPAAVAGMMVPAALITVGLTVAFVSVADVPITRAALAGVAPVAAGMTIGLGLDNARSALRRGRRGLIDAGVTALAFLVLALGQTSPVAVIVAASIVGAVALGRERHPPEPRE